MMRSSRLKSHSAVVTFMALIVVTLALTQTISKAATQGNPKPIDRLVQVISNTVKNVPRVPEVPLPQHPLRAVVMQEAEDGTKVISHVAHCERVNEMLGHSDSAWRNLIGYFVRIAEGLTPTDVEGLYEDSQCDLYEGDDDGEGDPED